MSIEVDPWENVESEAFRFEGLPAYSANEFDARFEEFRRTGSIANNEETSWSREVAALKRDGIAVRRLRATSTPLSEYEDYELRAGYHPAIQSGEQIRVVPRAQLAGIDKLTDFWLFDNKIVQLLNYDENGKLEGRTLSTVAENRLLVDRVLSIFRSAPPVELD